MPYSFTIEFHDNDIEADRLVCFNITIPEEHKAVHAFIGQLVGLNGPTYSLLPNEMGYLIEFIENQLTNRLPL
jgi:hypothetical protein